MRKQDKTLLWIAAGAAALYFFTRKKEPAKPPVMPGYVPGVQHKHMPLPKGAPLLRPQPKPQAVPDEKGPLSPGELWRQYEQEHENDDLNDNYN